MNKIISLIKDNPLSAKVLKILDYYEQIISLPHRSELLRAQLKQDDLFLLLCFSELLGLPNPVSYYTLELYPHIIKRFHAWHIKLGLQHSPLAGIRCC